MAKPFVDYSLREIDADGPEAVCRWVQKALRSSAVLFYCDDKDIQFYRNNIRSAFQINQRGDFKYF